MYRNVKKLNQKEVLSYLDKHITLSLYRSEPSPATLTYSFRGNRQDLPYSAVDLPRIMELVRLKNRILYMLGLSTRLIEIIL